MLAVPMLKRIAAIVLLISFFLPLSSCVYKQPAIEGNQTILRTTEGLEIAAYSAYDWPSVASAVALFLFTWPICVQFLMRKQRVWPSWLILIEALLLILTLCGISYLVCLRHKIRYGAWIAYAATAIYAWAMWQAHLISRRERV